MNTSLAFNQWKNGLVFNYGATTPGYGNVDYYLLCKDSYYAYFDYLLLCAKILSLE